MDNKIYDIFLSYRREDGAEFCEGLANELIKQGFSVFFDKKALRGGCDFPNHIRLAVENCSEFILIASKSYFGINKNNEIRISNDDDWCAKELELALKNNKINVFPILIDTKPPDKKNLPLKIEKVLDINFINYDRSIDTYDKIVDRINKGFHSSTIENAIVGHIINKINNVQANNLIEFNIACKEVMKLLNSKNDENALIHILQNKVNNKFLYDDDKRFIAFYTLFSYYRRIRQTLKMIKLIEENVGFSKYLFYDYVLTEYNVSKFNLSDNKNDEYKFLTMALKHSKLALKNISGNNGIIHSFCLTVVLLLENKFKVDDEIVNDAVDLINEIIKNDSDYAKYYSTKARLFAQLKQYDEALMNIRYAETLESAESKDWIMRISEYYKIETLINIMKYNKSNMKE